MSGDNSQILVPLQAAVKEKVRIVEAKMVTTYKPKHIYKTGSTEYRKLPKTSNLFSVRRLSINDVMHWGEGVHDVVMMREVGEGEGVKGYLTLCMSHLRQGLARECGW